MKYKERVFSFEQNVETPRLLCAKGEKQAPRYYYTHMEPHRHSFTNELVYKGTIIQPTQSAKQEHVIWNLQAKKVTGKYFPKNFMIQVQESGNTRYKKDMVSFIDALKKHWGMVQPMKDGQKINMIYTPERENAGGRRRLSDSVTK